MVVRQPQHKGIAAAGPGHIVVRRGPDIGTDEELAIGRGQHDHLRAIGIVQHIIAVALGQLGNQDIAQKGLVIAQSPQPGGGVEQAFILLGIEPKRSQRCTDVGQ